MFKQGDVLDEKYVVVRLLGKGGIGAVYEARHLAMDRAVAVKVLLSKSLRSQETVARFVNEARATAIIGSDHIVDIFDAGILQGVTPYIVMEFLDGQDLKKIFESQRVLEQQRAVGLVLQACEGLAAAHHRHIVHRDLKPSNLFITNSDSGDEWVTIVDFGIAKFRGAPQTEADPLTADGATLGTPRYMSPEQLGSAEKVDLRADIYSLGLILYEAVTGSVPFGNGAIDQLLARAAKEMPPSPKVFRPDLKADLDIAILKAIAPRREDRFSSMDDFRLCLEGTLSKMKTRASVPSGSGGSASVPGGSAFVPGGSGGDVSVPGGSGGSASVTGGSGGDASVTGGSGGSASVTGGSGGDASVTGGEAQLKPLTKTAIVVVSLVVMFIGVTAAVAIGFMIIDRWTVSPTVPSPPLDSPEILRPHESMVDPSTIDASQAPSKGPSDALVTIYEFTDYQCGPCNRAHTTAGISWNAHRDDVRWVLFNFPIDMACNPRVMYPAHQEACHAASVAVCAEEQGRFWEMTDELHRLGGTLGPHQRRGAATRVGLNLSQLDRCMSSDRPQLRIDHDIAQAMLFQIDSTPVFIINGRLVHGDPGNMMEAMIQYLLEHDGRWPQRNLHPPR